MTLNKSDLIKTRSYNSLFDEGFIYSNWLMGLYFGSDFFQKIDQDAYYLGYKHVVKKIIENPKTKIEIAILKEDPLTNLGFCVSEAPILHYIYIKPNWRGIGLTKDLLPKDLSFTTHLTDVGEKIMKKNYPAMKFNPFLI